jgi:hypothetical protein
MNDLDCLLQCPLQVYRTRIKGVDDELMMGEGAVVD